MITSTIIHIKEVIPTLEKIVPNLYSISDNHFEKQLSPLLDALKDELYVFIEYPYVDKMYRDSYYSFYSKKHKTYLRDSFRISFFVGKIEENWFRHKTSSEKLKKSFLGYTTLRPTSFRLIGSTIISPFAFKQNNFVCCLTNREVLINGIKLTVNGFPFSSQDNETTTCAETCLVNIMEYFGTKYYEYKTILPSQIHDILSNQSYERQLPSMGLPSEDISFVLKTVGL